MRSSSCLFGSDQGANYSFESCGFEGSGNVFIAARGECLLAKLIGAISRHSHNRNVVD